jgi:hypothetical protein
MAIAAPPPPVSRVEIDWEASAGAPDRTRARVGPLAYTYLGAGDAHWQGQRCGVQSAEDGDGYHVVFGCGCRAVVPVWTLAPVIDPHR